MSIWIIISLAFITLFNRYFFLIQWLPYQPSDRVKRFLGYASYSILTAIWVPLLWHINDNEKAHYAGTDYLIASVLTALLLYITKNALVTIAISLFSFFVLRFYLLT